MFAGHCTPADPRASLQKLARRFACLLAQRCPVRRRVRVRTHSQSVSGPHEMPLCCTGQWLTLLPPQSPLRRPLLSLPRPTSSAMPRPTLPAELIRAILQHLNDGGYKYKTQPALAACCLASKGFLPLARE